MKHPPKIVLVVEEGDEFRSRDDILLHDLRQIRMLLEAILKALTPPVPASLILVAGPVTEQSNLPTIPVESHPMQITDSQKFSYGLVEADKKGQSTGQPVKFDAAPTWASSNPNVATVTLNADGASGDVVAGVPGTTTISVTGTLNGQAVSGSDDLTVTPGAPVQIALQAGPVSEQS